MLDIRDMFKETFLLLGGDPARFAHVDRDTNTPDRGYLYDLVAVHRAKARASNEEAQSLAALIKRLRGG